MSTRDRMYELLTVEEVDEFLKRYPTSAFFKAGGCHKTMQGFGYVETALNSREDIQLACVKVIESRPVSNYIAELTGVVHQSPQFILMVDGKPVYDVDNWDITPEVLEEALTQHLGAAKNSASAKAATTSQELQPYIDLIQQLLQGDIEEEDFSQRWLSTFQMDATLRSQEEFAILNSLYGDVDKAIELGVPKSIKDQTLVERAEQILTLITTK